LNRPFIVAAAAGVLAVSVYAIISAIADKKDPAETANSAAGTVTGSKIKTAATKPLETQSVANQEGKGADSAATRSKNANDTASAKSDVSSVPNDLT